MFMVTTNIIVIPCVRKRLDLFWCTDLLSISTEWNILRFTFTNIRNYFKNLSKYTISTFAYINPLNPVLNPICCLLALLGANHFRHVRRIKVKSLTLGLPYDIYMEHPLLMFLDHTRRTTVGRTPLDEWSARRRDLYLTTHDTHNRQISMPPVGFEPKILAGERPQAAHLLR